MELKNDDDSMGPDVLSRATPQSEPMTIRNSQIPDAVRTLRTTGSLAEGAGRARTCVNPPEGALMPARNPPLMRCYHKLDQLI